MQTQKIKELYQKKFAKHGHAPESLLWGSRGAAHQRFRQFWNEIDFSNKTVLDVGCGFGELSKFLDKKFINVNYTGIDIVPEFINQAKLLYPHDKFPNRQFLVKDYLSEPISEKYDIVIASGILNSQVPSNVQYRENAIKTLWDISGRVFAFNMLGGHPQPENKAKSNVWYADSFKILNYCATLTNKVVFKSNYHPKDFTIFVYK